MNQNSETEVKETIKTFTQEQVDSIVKARVAKSNEKLETVQSLYNGLQKVQEEQAVKETLLKEGFNEAHLGKVIKLINPDKDLATQLKDLKQIQGFTKSEVPNSDVNTKQEINTNTLAVSGEISKQDTKPKFNKVGRYNI